MNCEICNKLIKPKDKRFQYREAEHTPPTSFHLCCYQEVLLCEVWGALQLGIKYKSGCEHTDRTSNFDPFEERR